VDLLGASGEPVRGNATTVFGEWQEVQSSCMGVIHMHGAL